MSSLLASNKTFKTFKTFEATTLTHFDKYSDLLFITSTHINETIISDSRSWDCCQAIWQALVVFSSVSFVMIPDPFQSFLLWWCLYHTVYGRVSSDCQSLSLSKSCLKHTGNLTNNRYTAIVITIISFTEGQFGENTVSKTSLCLLARWSSYCDIMFG